MRRYVGFFVVVMASLIASQEAHGADDPIVKVMLVPSPAPSVAATPYPRPSVLYQIPDSEHSAQRVFYVLSDGKGDAAAVPLLLRSIVARLSKHAKQVHTDGDAPWIVPRPDWALSDFTNACESGSGTLGELVVLNALQNQGTENYVIWSYGWTRVNANVLVLSCPIDNDTLAQKSSPMAPIPPYLVDAENEFEGGGYRHGFPFTIAAAVASFFKQNQTTTTTTSTAPATPAPGTTPNPLASASTSTVTTSVNPEGPLVFASVTSSLGTVTAPQINQPAELSVAAWHVADDIMRRLFNSCAVAAPRATTGAKDVASELTRQCRALGLGVTPFEP